MSSANKSSANKSNASIKTAINITRTTDRAIDPQDIELTNVDLRAFADGGIPGETDEEKGKAALELIERSWLKHHGLIDASIKEKRKAIKELHKQMLEGDSDAPELLVAQKILRRLVQGEHERALQVAEDSIKLRKAVGENAISKQASQNRRKTDDKQSDVAKVFRGILKKMPDITPSGMKVRLHDMVSNGVLAEYDHDEDEFVGFDKKTISGTTDALKTRLKRERKNNK